MVPSKLCRNHASYTLLDITIQLQEFRQGRLYFLNSLNLAYVLYTALSHNLHIEVGMSRCICNLTV